MKSADDWAREAIRLLGLERRPPLERRLMDVLPDVFARCMREVRVETLRDCEEVVFTSEEMEECHGR